MEILVLCGIYVVELVCFQLGLKMLFDVQVKTKKWMIVGILLPVGICLILSDDATAKNLLITIVTMSVMFISIEGRIAEKGIRLIFILLLLECIDVVFFPLCDMIFKSIDNSYIENISYLVVKCCIVLCVLLFSMIKEKMNHYCKIHINSIIYLIIGIIAFSMILCLMILNNIINGLHNKRQIIFGYILEETILFSIFFLVIFVIYIKNTHERMEQLLKTEQLLKEAQVSYYNQALKKEIDTRKYRHDMVNHLVYVQDILSKNKIDDAQRYLAGILGGFKRIQSAYYVIGNEMVDSIINYFFEMLPDNVSVDIKGKCPVKFDMEDTDVCTIFSNLLQNTVEEIRSCNILDAHIILEVRKGRQYAEYSIKNTLVSEIKENGSDKNKLPISNKQDKENHGIGMVNAKNAVERNKGKFEWYQKDGYFCVNIVLPIKSR